MFLKVYLTDISPLYDDEVFERYYKEALHYRKKKVDGLKLKKPKCQSLGAGVLLKKALEDVGVESDFEISNKGKPELKSNKSHVLFNLSHSGDRAMCVISDCPVGCDVETVKENKRVADRFFTEAEANLANRSAADFTRIWTLKESFIKTTGEGLGRVLESFSLDFDRDENVKGVIVDGIARKEFSFYELNYEDGYRYAICIKGDTEGVKPEVEWVKL